MAAEHKKELYKKMLNAKRASTKATGEYRELRTDWLLLYGESDEEKKLGAAYKVAFSDPRKERREKTKKNRDTKKIGKAPIEKLAKKEIKAKKVRVMPKKNQPVTEPSNWTVETDCKGSEIHGDACQATTDANKERAKADTRHEGKKFPTCKGCKKFIATKRKEERVVNEPSSPSPSPPSPLSDNVGEEDEQDENE